MSVNVGAPVTVTVTINPADKVEGADVFPVPANSGGAILSSGEVVTISMKAWTKNSGDIYIGGPDNPPYSGHGYCLEPGESWHVAIKNLNQVRLVSIVSGDIVTWGTVK